MACVVEQHLHVLDGATGVVLPHIHVRWLLPIEHSHELVRESQFLPQPTRRMVTSKSKPEMSTVKGSDDVGGDEENDGDLCRPRPLPPRRPHP